MQKIVDEVDVPLSSQIVNNSNLDNNLSREAIKEARKIRNKLKKEKKREEKAQQNAFKRYELTLDKNVTIVSRDFAQQVFSNSETTYQQPTCSMSQTEYNASYSDFPSLNEKKIYNKPAKITSLNHLTSFIPYQNSSDTTNIPNTSKTNSMHIMISDIIERRTKPIVQRPTVKYDNVVLYSGNNLDGSQPERKVGKFRESTQKKVRTFKKNIMKDNEIALSENNTDCLKVYTDHNITEELNNKVVNFLQTIVRYQDNLYKRDPIRGQSKRRYYVGFHQVKKYLLLNKVKLLIIAPDLKVVENGLCL